MMVREKARDLRGRWNPESYASRTIQVMDLDTGQHVPVEVVRIPRGAFYYPNLSPVESVDWLTVEWVMGDLHPPFEARLPVGDELDRAVDLVHQIRGVNYGALVFLCLRLLYRHKKTGKCLFRIEVGAVTHNYYGSPKWKFLVLPEHDIDFPPAVMGSDIDKAFQYALGFFGGFAKYLMPVVTTAEDNYFGIPNNVISDEDVLYSIYRLYPELEVLAQLEN